MVRSRNTILVNKEENIRLDKFLKRVLSSFSRNKIEEYIKKGLILVNNKEVKPSYLLKINDIISYPVEFPREINDLIPLNLNPEPLVLYEDDNIIVINKPPHILVHPTKNSILTPSIASWLIYRYPEVKNVGDDPLRPGIVHRLDKDTSGVLILTKNQKTFENFKNLFAQRKIEKVYLVLVKGQLKQKEGRISYNIGEAKDYPKRKIILSSQKNTAGKEALTVFRVLNTFNNYTLLEVMPKTGRTHQIRVHLASIGFPVLGDRLYGKITNQEKELIPRQMIHAFKISFPYDNNQTLSFEAPLPNDFQNILNQLTKEGTL